MTLVAVLKIAPGSLAAFRDYERQAARIMAGYGARIERAIFVPPLTEIHVVVFPDEDSFEAYRKDPSLTKLQSTREHCIESTEIYRGVDGPVYPSE